MQQYQIVYNHFCVIISFTNLIMLKMKTLMPITKEDVQLTVCSYEAPTIELIEVTVEKGFADSIVNWSSQAW